MIMPGDCSEELVELIAETLRLVDVKLAINDAGVWYVERAKSVLAVLSERLVPLGSRVSDEYGTHAGVREHRRVITTPWTPSEPAQEER